MIEGNDQSRRDETTQSHRVVFMTSIGTTPYSPVSYLPLHPSLEPMLRNRFFPLIRLKQLQSHARIDTVMLLLTPEARERHWGEDSELRKGFEELGHQVNPIDISAPQSEADLYALLETIVSHYQEGDEIYLDITNAFRSLGYVFNTAAELGEMTKSVTIKEISYGAFEVIDRSDTETPRPIWDLKHIVEISGWTSAYRRFERSGDPLPLAELVETLVDEVERDSEAKEALCTFSELLRAVADSLMVLNIPELNVCLIELDRHLDSLADQISRHQHDAREEPGAWGVLRLILPKLRGTIKELADAVDGAELIELREGVLSLPFPPVNLCRWLAARGRLLSAVGLLRESLMGLFYDPRSAYTYEVAPAPPLTKSVEALIGAIGYAARDKTHKRIEVERLIVEERRVFCEWWNGLELETRGGSAKLFNRVSQLRNKLLHGWTKSNDRDQSQRYKRKGRSAHTETQKTLNELIDEITELRRPLDR